jgi:hypothetical protein
MQYIYYKLVTSNYYHCISTVSRTYKYFIYTDEVTLSIQCVLTKLKLAYSSTLLQIYNSTTFHCLFFKQTVQILNDKLIIYIIFVYNYILLIKCEHLSQC